MQVTPPMPTLWETPTVPGVRRKRSTTRKPTDRETMGCAIWPTAYISHSWQQPHGVSRPPKVKGTGASLRGPPVPFHWGSRPRRWPCTPGRTGELAVLSKVRRPRQSRGWRARTGSMDSRKHPFRGPTAEDTLTLGVEAECQLEAEAWLCSQRPPLSQVIHFHVGPTGVEGWKKQCRGCQLTIPYLHLPAGGCAPGPGGGPA